MRKVYALGVGQTAFGKLGTDPILLGMEAAKAAIKDAGIDPRKLQVAYGCQAINNKGATPIQDVMSNLGVAEIEMTNVFNACGGGITATNLLWRDIANGIYDIGIAVGMENMTSNIKGLLAPNDGRDLNGSLGLSMPSYFGLIARRVMYEYGATREDIAYPSVKNHINACLNPNGMYKKKFTTEDIVNSEVISDPLTKLECCPNADGAAAVILCTEEIARQYTTKLVCIAYSEIISGYLDWPGRNILEGKSLRALSKRAYERAGVDAKDIRVIEMHDAFSSEEITNIEDMLICERGECIKLMREGYFEIDGKCAVNPSGGLLALGHPIAASGVRVMVDVVRQVRGDAGAYQVKDVKVGAAQMLGGYLTSLVPPIAGGLQIITR